MEASPAAASASASCTASAKRRASSLAEAGRWAGSLARHCSTISATDAGTDGKTWRIGLTSSLMCMANSRAGVSLKKGGLPDNIQ